MEDESGRWRRAATETLPRVETRSRHLITMGTYMLVVYFQLISFGRPWWQRLPPPPPKHLRFIYGVPASKKWQKWLDWSTLVAEYHRLEAVYGIPTLMNLRVLFLTFTLQSGTRTMEFHIESKYVFIFETPFEKRKKQVLFPSPTTTTLSWYIHYETNSELKNIVVINSSEPEVSINSKEGVSLSNYPSCFFFLV